MPVAYFVSDIHIMSAECPRARQFLGFLKSLPGDTGITQLYLLGDIFDLWVAGHRYFIEAYQEIIDEIRRLKQAGVEISYFEGNHDLHLRSFWQDELGLTVHTDPIYAGLGSTVVRLEHGDQMDPDDKGYLFLRWFLRTPPIRFLICNLPGSIVARIGDKASAQSREYTSNTKTIERNDAIMKMHAHARRVYAEKPFDLIISGHVHFRDDSQIETAEGTFRNVNLGSWLDAPTYFKIDDEEALFIELEQTDTPKPDAEDRSRVTAVQ